jgi:hypothetical protein
VGIGDRRIITAPESNIRLAILAVCVIPGGDAIDVDRFLLLIIN